MVTVEISAMFILAGLFGVFATVVAYDVYSATRLRWLLNPSGARRVFLFRVTKQRRPDPKFGAVSRARGASLERRPKSLWVARFASLEQKS